MLFVGYQIEVTKSHLCGTIPSTAVDGFVNFAFFVKLVFDNFVETFPGFYKPK